ncbi:hypothetical protein ABPG72_004209 [Tetrahymena utriculariae]
MLLNKLIIIFSPDKQIIKMINVLFSNEELRYSQEITQESYKQFARLKYSGLYDISSKYKGQITVEQGRVNPQPQQQYPQSCIYNASEAIKDPSAIKITSLLLTLKLNAIKDNMPALIPMIVQTAQFIKKPSLYQKISSQLLTKYQLNTQIRNGTLANPIMHINIVKIQLG